MSWPWPAPVDDGGAQHLRPGKALPDVELPATTGGTVRPGAISGSSVVFVYPWTGRIGVANPPRWDEIPGAHGSTAEAEGFRDRHDLYRSRGITVLGLSMQSSLEQQEFAARLALPFALLADEDRTFSAALRLPTFETGGISYLKRLTLVVADGHITRVVYPVHPPDRHARELLALLAD